MVLAVPAQAATVGAGKYASGSPNGVALVTGLGEKEQKKQLTLPTTLIWLMVTLAKVRKPHMALELVESTIMAQLGALTRLSERGSNVTPYVAEESKA